jgi:hypothetical protein
MTPKAGVNDFIVPKNTAASGYLGACLRTQFNEV